MNVYFYSKYLFNTHYIISNTISTISLCTLCVPIPCVMLATSSDSLRYYRTFCPHIKSNYCRNNISKTYSSLFKMTSEAINPNDQSSVMRLEDYDCIGFDLDNTICEYNIASSVQMEYEVLANFLVSQKGYDAHLLEPLDANSIDFLQKGLIIDFAKGNILKIGENGVILKASHGTKQMTDEEIIINYGAHKKWQVTSDFSENLLVAWEGPLSDKMRALLDYFDMPASLAFARIIDSLGDKLGEPKDMSNIWVDVKEGLINMYKREHFVDGKGDYFQEIKSNPGKFIQKSDTYVIEWLKKIKASKLTFLITGSHCDFASLTAETCLGKDWRSLFDIVICYARKPGFFAGYRPFVKLENLKETSVIDGIDLQFGHIYSQGNWQELYQLFARQLNKKQPKCLYFGDNLIQDIYTPSKYTNCDTVAVVEELTAERKMIAKYPKMHNSQTILESKFWGSYFYDSKQQLNTIWGNVIKKNSKICVPSLSILSQYSLNEELPTFSNSYEMDNFPTGPT